MNALPPEGFLAFTATYDSRASLLRNVAKIRAAVGPSSSGEAAPGDPREFNVIWDTGATGCVITQSVVDSCSLKPIGMTQVSHAQGETMAEVYLVDILLPNGVTFAGAAVTKGILRGVDALIGMDVISQGDFAVTNVNEKTTMTFRVPSVATVDYVKVANARNPKAKSPDIGRNDQCPCGSGRKYKKCCGAVAANGH